MGTLLSLQKDKTRSHVRCFHGAAALTETRRCLHTWPIDPHQTALISTLRYDYASRGSEPNAINYGRDLELFTWTVFFLDMPLSFPTNFLSHPRRDPIKPEKAEIYCLNER